MRKNNKGFTLLEILGVILLIAMLMVIAMTAANHVIKGARIRQIYMTFPVLENAITAYHRQYEMWPGIDPKEEDGRYVRNTTTGEYYDQGFVFESNSSRLNGKVIHALMVDNNAPPPNGNPDGIKFVDETIFRVWDNSKKQLVPLALNRELVNSSWLGFRDPTSTPPNKLKAYTITIMPLDRKVRVLGIDKEGEFR